MAKISQTSITLELETLACDDMGDGIVLIDVTVEEAQELMNLLKERFGEKLQYPVYPHHVRGTVNGFDEVNRDLDRKWLEERYGVDNWEDAMDNKTTGIVEDKNRSTS